MSLTARIAGAFVALASLSSLALTQSKVWIVDSDLLPGADFADVQPAVDAASDGDVILVRGRSGDVYGPVVIGGKSLAVHGEPDESGPFLSIEYPRTGPIWVRDLVLGQRVTLRGLRAENAAPSTLPALLVTGTAGSVHVEGCSFDRPATGAGQPLPPSCALAIGAGSLTIVRSSIHGERGGPGETAGLGLVLADSQVFLHAIEVHGGDGADAANPAPFVVLPAGDGGASVAVAGGLLYVDSSELVGGRGGAGFEDAAFTCYPAGDGGAGLVLAPWTAPPNVQLASLAPEGGASGTAPTLNCPPGQPGDALQPPNGIVHTVSVAPRSLVSTSPVREDESLFLQLGGVPGDPVFLLIGAAGQPLFGAAWVGPLHVAPGAAVVALGVLPANGQLELGLAVPELGVGIEAVGLELQAAFIDGALLHLALSEPSAVLLLDRSL